MARQKSEASRNSTPSGASVGRPGKLTPTRRKRILELIRAGNRRTAAARAAGIGEATFFRWMADQRPMYQRFRMDVEQAEAEFEADLVDVVVSSAPRSPHLAWRMLEARSGEWRRGKLPAEPEPEPEPIPEPEPAHVRHVPTMMLTPDEARVIWERRRNVEQGYPPEGPPPEVLAARRRLVEDHHPTSPGPPFQIGPPPPPIPAAVLAEPPEEDGS